MTKQLERGQLEVDTLKHFLNGGFGTITITNTRTDMHVTLRFAEPKPKAGKARDPFAPIFVKLFTGQEGEIKLKRAYSYFGCIWRKDRRTGKAQRPTFWFDSFKAKGGIKGGDACVKTVAWLMRVASGETPLVDYMQLWHEGLCCFCGRPLTQTESIKRGYGPKCAEHRSLPYGKVTKRAKKTERVIPTAKGDETYDERVMDLVAAGFSVKASETIAKAEVKPTQTEILPAVEVAPEPVTACGDDLSGFKWV